MARINLLPWRQERRKQRQQEFMSLMAMAAVVAIVISGLIWVYYKGQIEGQNNRNRYLEGQIAQVMDQIKEIDELDKKKARLLRRKEVIEELQASRSQMVHLFDELVRTVPDGLRLNSIKQKGNDLTLEGFAQSNARVSTYMRNLQVSGWMTKPELSVIEARGKDPGLPYAFSLRVTLKSPQDTDAQAAAANPQPANEPGSMPLSEAVPEQAPAATPPAAAAPASATPAPATPAPTPPASGAPTGGQP